MGVDSELSKVNPDQLFKRVDLDPKSKRMLRESMEGLPKIKRIEILRQRFPQLFDNGQSGQESILSASD